MFCELNVKHGNERPGNFTSYKDKSVTCPKRDLKVIKVNKIEAKMK